MDLVYLVYFVNKRNLILIEVVPGYLVRALFNCKSVISTEYNGLNRIRWGECSVAVDGHTEQDMVLSADGEYSTLWAGSVRRV